MPALTVFLSVVAGVSTPSIGAPPRGAIHVESIHALEAIVRSALDAFGLESLTPPPRALVDPRRLTDDVASAGRESDPEPFTVRFAVDESGAIVPVALRAGADGSTIGLSWSRATQPGWRVDWSADLSQWLLHRGDDSVGSIDEFDAAARALPGVVGAVLEPGAFEALLTRVPELRALEPVGPHLGRPSAGERFEISIDAPGSSLLELEDLVGPRRLSPELGIVRVSWNVAAREADEDRDVDPAARSGTAFDRATAASLVAVLEPTAPLRLIDRRRGLAIAIEPGRGGATWTIATLATDADVFDRELAAWRDRFAAVEPPEPLGMRLDWMLASIDHLRPASDAPIEVERGDGVLIGRIGTPGIEDDATSVPAIPFTATIDAHPGASIVARIDPARLLLTVLRSSEREPPATLSRRHGRAPLEIVVDERTDGRSTWTLRLALQDVARLSRGFSGFGGDQLVDAVIANDPIAIAELLATGADPEADAPRSALRPIDIAAARGMLEPLEALIAGGATVDPARRGRDGPLHRAVEVGAREAVELLLDSGADPNAMGRRSRTPTMIAAQRGDERLLRAIVRAGGDPRIVTTAGNTVNAAVNAGAPEMVAWLMQRGTTDGARELGTRWPIVAAIEHPDVATRHALVGVLLERRSVRQMTPAMRISALEAALESGDPVVIMWLLRDGAASATLADGPGTNRLASAAAGSGAWSLLEPVLARGDSVLGKDAALVAAARAGLLEDVERLIELGADPNTAGAKSEGPLEAAAGGEPPRIDARLAIVDRLVAAGAAVDGVGGFMPPVQAAARAGRVELVARLLASGALPDTRARNGNDLLSSLAGAGLDEETRRAIIRLAIAAGHVPAVTHGDDGGPILAAARANDLPMLRTLRSMNFTWPLVEGRPWSGNEVFCEAVRRRSGAVLRELLRFLPPEDSWPQRDRIRRRRMLAEGLVVAASMDAVEAVEALLAAGAEPDARDERRRGALHLAASRGALGTVRALLLGGADPTLPDGDGVLPVDRIGRGQEADVIRSLLEAATPPVESAP